LIELVISDYLDCCDLHNDFARMSFINENPHRFSELKIIDG
jgi:hypothetical protein